MISDSHTRYRSVVSRQGRGLLLASYQLSRAARNSSTCDGSGPLVRLGRCSAWAGLVCFVFSAILISSFSLNVQAQWHILVEGNPELQETQRPWPADSLSWAIREVMDSLHKEGYLYAYTEDPDSVAGQLVIHAGDQALIGRLILEGAHAEDSLYVRDRLQVHIGHPLTSETLKELADTVLEIYTHHGYHLNTVTIRSLVPSVPPLVDVYVQVAEYPQPVLSRVEVTGGKRTKPGVLYRLSGLLPKAPIVDFDADRLRERLQRTGLFSRIDGVALQVDEGSNLVVHVDASEASPGAFDLALGYERSGTGAGALIGSGHLALRNLFGGARILAITLHRLPSQVSRINVTGSDPYLMGLPLGLGLEFRGLQQDSTYGKRDYRLELGYELDSSMQLFGLISREVTRPGLSGLTIIDGRQRIPSAVSILAGVGLGIRNVDHRLNPTRGYFLEMALESGYKQMEVEVVRADTVSEHQRLRISRLIARGRLFLPHGKRRVLVTGGDVYLLHAREYDESDLFRLGGANSLRGYDEDRFRGPFVARALLEYRYTFDDLTFGFLFTDVGFVDARHNPDGKFDVFPGFGTGFQLDTQAGLINLTLASSLDDPTAVRAHMRVSLGL